MKVYRMKLEYTDYTVFDVFVFINDEKAADYIEKTGMEVEEVALPNHEMRLTPLFELCEGMYGVYKGQYGKWEEEDFEGGAA